MSSIDSFIFKMPFACMMAGPSQSGKSTLLVDILNDSINMISPSPQRIVYCYSTWSEGYKNIKNTEFLQGLPDLESFDPNINNILVLDDLMAQVANNESMSDLFTVGSHHFNIGVFLLTQNLFSQAKFA